MKKPWKQNMETLWIPPYSTLHPRVQVQKADALDLTEAPTMVVILVIRQGSLQATDHY
jgi:hypothetical protein